MTIRYTRDHQYIRVEGEEGEVGITDHAQARLGDIVFVELPVIGRVLTMGGEAAVVESVKTASDVFAPVAGTVIAVNTLLETAPATVNEDPAGRGWFFRINVSDPSQLDELMSRSDYDAYVEAQG